MIQAPSPGGEQEMLCLPLEYLNGWLFGIDDRRVIPEIRDALVLYKREAYVALHDYFVKGFALNDRRLTQDRTALDAVAARVRALRSDERNIYQAVRDVFAFGSSDYSKDSPEARAFFAKVQDKFLYAVTGMTAAQIKLARADHRLPAMGLYSMRGECPERADADVGKNYLTVGSFTLCTSSASNSCSSWSPRRSVAKGLRWQRYRASSTNCSWCKGTLYSRNTAKPGHRKLSHTRSKNLTFGVSGRVGCHHHRGE
jgi:hypothetical protein